MSTVAVIRTMLWLLSCELRYYYVQSKDLRPTVQHTSSCLREYNKI